MEGWGLHANRAQTGARDSSFSSQRGLKGADRFGQDGSNLVAESDGLGL